MSMVDEMQLDGQLGLPGMPTESEASNASVEAPYGLTEDGKPRAKPGRKPGQKTGTGQRRTTTAKKTIPAPARKATPAKPPAAKTGTTDYRPAITALLGEGVGSLAVIGLMRDEMALVADAATIADAVPAIADVTNLAAEKWPVVAAILDRFLPLAASAKSGGTILLMAAQLAVNHGKLPPGLIPGTVSVETKVSTFIADQIASNPDFAAMIAGIQGAKQPPMPSTI